ncbi:alpha-hydroxy acid oxidase [Portibacter lacus]|uniref:Alpha-hydroxy-acid oxidizing enzyme n=1 Tax=Portibacter lacus TaxID=1099794 RepID=A0AA37SS94_9BACT|nr:alpha-hydroxy acid oxidase [Portibacter lacus]GLR20041.1 alpha-hydroxy-acid oxidizing enzyme [Portibacter lacus]
MAEIIIDPKLPSIEHLKAKTKKRIPRFAYEYLSGGCNNEVNLRKNTAEIRDIELKPYYLRDYGGIDMKTELFGHTYDAPFGISPIGLQGLIWPRATEILAKAAHDHNLPFILSTVATADVETVAEITEGKAWFQLYHPAEKELRNKLIKRVDEAGYPVLVILSDVPTFGYRPKEIKNGLSIPPKLTIPNMLQIMANPNWALSTLLAGQPEFKTLKPYVPKGLNLKHLGLFMNKTFNGRMSEDRIKEIRDMWKGKIVMKGAASHEDIQKSIEIGLDGVIISNHGGRQLDAGQSTIAVVSDIIEEFKGKTKIMMDSGMRCGPDIASTLATGAEFAFLGRAPMYGVGAMGKKGGNQAISILKRELQQVMEQLCCERVEDLHKHLIKK